MKAITLSTWYYFLLSGFTDVNTVSLSDVERAWIAKHQRITVGISEDWPPFEYRDHFGHIRGIDIDILRVIGELTGLEILFKSDNWSNNLKSFKRGQLDLLTGVKYIAHREEIGIILRLIYKCSITSLPINVTRIHQYRN
ncbi:transporter substrate-binding domain-containing protein [Psychrobium sp. nBUS_13]|uniref:transporter substrate-binding domain-containing protein n=1 Tax=Psychrobium sp. nBUS_13 TaxID=3395319 RepID=UPI003EC0D743